jgi:hypothetical protein
MKSQGGLGIFWMVRLLGALGFVMVAVMIGQSGLQLRSIRNSRVHLQKEYDANLENLQEQRTQVRAYVAALRNEAELQEGRRRLQEAIQFNAWRMAQGEDAARLALSLTKQR